MTDESFDVLGGPFDDVFDAVPRETSAILDNKGVWPDFIWCTGSAACSNSGRNIGPRELKQTFLFS